MLGGMSPSIDVWSFPPNAREDCNLLDVPVAVLSGTGAGADETVTKGSILYREVFFRPFPGQHSRHRKVKRSTCLLVTPTRNLVSDGGEKEGDVASG